MIKFPCNDRRTGSYCSIPGPAWKFITSILQTKHNMVRENEDPVIHGSPRPKTRDYLFCFLCGHQICILLIKFIK